MVGQPDQADDSYTGGLTQDCHTGGKSPDPKIWGSLGPCLGLANFSFVLGSPETSGGKNLSQQSP